MNARLLFVLLIISLALALTARFRRAGVVLSIGLLVLLVWFNLHPRESVDPHRVVSSSSVSSMRSVETMPASSVELIDVQLAGTGAPWQIVGKARNTTSDHTITAITLRAIRYDCPSNETTLSDCTINWQGEPTLHVKLPATTMQPINESVWSHDSTSRITGSARVEITVLAVQGTASHKTR